MNKLTSLARFLNCEKWELEQTKYDENVYSIGNREYKILTDTEATREAKNYILESAWAFNTWFILDNLNSKFEKVDREVMEEIIKNAQEKCESGNDVILGMIKKRDFVSDAIRYDGRGHFLSSYDGNENEQDCYFIYRTN